MAISVQCPACQKGLKTKEEMAGKRIKCPLCGHVFAVPETALTSEAPLPAKPRLAAETSTSLARGGGAGNGNVTANQSASVEALRPAFKKQEVPDDMVDKILEELEPGEKVLWIGRCVPEDILARYKSLYDRIGSIKKLARWLFIGAVALPVIALLACGLTINFLIGALVGVGGAVFLAGCGGIALLIAGGIGKSQHKAENEQETRPCYVVTAKRVLIHCGTWDQDGGQFQIYLPNDLKAMRRVDSQFTEGVGDLIFKKTTVRDGGSKLVRRSTGTTVGHRPGATIEYEYGMKSVPNAKAVERLIRERLLGEKGAS